MPSALDDLPSEILTRIAEFLPLWMRKGFRRLSSRTCSAATPTVFHTIWIAVSSNTDIDAAICVAERPHLAKHVRRVRFITYESQCTSSESPLETSRGGKRAFDVRFHRRWDRLRDLRFPSPRSAEVSFDSEPGIFEHRRVILEAFLDYVDRNPSIREVTLRNLMNRNHHEIVLGERFQSILARLKSLRLDIATHVDEDQEQPTLYENDLHRFSAELIPYWIRPAFDGLTRLAIYMNRRWGYTPKMDFRDVHLPHLRILEMGGWVISHDWQLDWIISHRSTLETLWLDHPAILVKARCYVDLDGEGYPHHVEGQNWIDMVQQRPRYYTYNRRWSSFFDRLALGLPKLNDFRFGASTASDEVVGDIEEPIEQVPLADYLPTEMSRQYTKYYIWCDYGSSRTWNNVPLVTISDEESENSLVRPDEQTTAHEHQIIDLQVFKRDMKSLRNLLKQIGHPVPSKSHCINLHIDSCWLITLAS